MNTKKRVVSAGVLLALSIVLSGCGGGAGSSNVDYGSSGGTYGGKSIQRSLENDTDMFVDVALRINDQQFLDEISIRPRSYINVVIDDLDYRDWVRYDARFENGDTTSGTFSEDGRTIFTHSGDGRAAAKPRSVEINGKDAVRPGGETVRLSAKSAKK